jgi:tetratricopeptide (TPR) repeat protein
MKGSGRHIITLFFCLYFSIFNTTAQSNKVDSLLSKLKNAEHDTSRIQILNDLSYTSYLNGDFESEMGFAKEALKLGQRISWQPGIAEAYKNIASAYEDVGDYAEALKYYSLALRLFEKLSDRAGQSVVLGNIGSVYHNLSNYSKALDYYFKSLKLDEELGNKKGVAFDYVNIGVVYFDQSNYEKAKDYYLKSLKMAEEMNDSNLMAINLGNIGNIYGAQLDYTEALDYYFRALRYTEAMKDIQGVTINLGNIATIYKDLKKYDSAMNFYLRALKQAEDIGDKNSTALNLINIGLLYTITCRYESAEIYLKKALELSKKIGTLEYEKTNYRLLSRLDSLRGNYRGALENFQWYIKMRDSIDNVELQKEQIRIETQYEFDKREAIAIAEQEKKEAIAAAENKKQAIVRNSLTGGFILMFLLALIIYKNYIRKQKDNLIITHQKFQVETKNREILDSINYAKRIQTAILPPVREIKKHLVDSFILYLPKDIVAGDFYWMDSPSTEESGQGAEVFIAACDCTGHGVPGAMVSVVCNNALNRAVNEFGERLPGKIFDKARELVLENFEKSDEEVKDGMDASLCALDIKNKKLLWAGANNPLWIIRKNSPSPEELGLGAEVIEYKPDKQPIGKGYDNKPFTTHEISLQEGDIIYLFTDGYADQFGGEKGKKMTKARFREFVLSIAHQSMEQQREALLKFHDEYRGNEEQVDDICVIGVRV